ncbi:MAG: hypothetical protein QW572_00525 [Candidatus Nitrosocaldus sp.]
MKAVALLLIIIFCSYMLAVLSLEHGRSILYRVDEYTDRYWNGYEWVYILYPLQIGVAEATSVIINGCNNLSVDECNDGDVRNGGGGAVNRTAADMRVGDDNANREFRSFVKFPISSLHGKTLKSAELKLTIRQSILNGSTDNSAPFNNPGLGNTLVMHINDYGTLDASDFNTPSIGNDPGVLIQASTNPSSANVSISVLAAMQDDISNSRNFTTYMIRAANGSDGDNRGDRWHFYTRNSGTTNAPRIEYTLSFVKDLKDMVKLSEHDILNRILASSRNAAITLHALDSSIRSVGHSRLIVDAQSIGDMLVRSIMVSEFFSDSISMLDDLIRKISVYIGVDEMLDATDVLARYSSTPRSILEPVLASDTLSRLLSATRDASATLTLTDKIGIGFLLNFIDHTSISDVLAFNISYTKFILDSLSVIADTNSHTSFLRVLQDALGSSDLVSYLHNLIVRDLMDGIGIIDEVSRLNEFSRVLDEPLAIGDGIGRMISSMSRVILEPLSTVDLLSNVTSFQRDIGTLLSIETVSVADSLSRSIDVVKGIVDSVNAIDDAPSLYNGFVRFLDESINVDDILARMVELTVEMVESASINHILSSYTTYFVRIVDGVDALISILASAVVGGSNTGTDNVGAGAGVGVGTVLGRSTFITVDISSLNDTILVEGFLMDREGLVPFNTTLSITVVGDATDARYVSEVEVVDGRYNKSIPIDELFNAIAPNSAEIRIKAIVTFNGAEHYLNGIRYLYLPSSAESREARVERGLVFEAPVFRIIPSSIIYSGERLLIIYIENDTEDDINSLRIAVNEGKVLKVKTSRNWKVSVGDGILLEGVDGHALKQGNRLIILMLKQGKLNYAVTAP